MNNYIGKLTIVDVPWAICASGSGGLFTMDLEKGTASVTFVAQQNVASLPEMCSVRVDVTGVWAWRAVPIRDEAYAYETAGYDTSLLPFDALRTDASRAVAAMREFWNREGRCPNPLMYEVTDSQWTRDFSEPKMKHLMFHLDEHFVEFFARSWSWSWGDITPQESPEDTTS
jgi:hypothetical protein